MIRYRWRKGATCYRRWTFGLHVYPAGVGYAVHLGPFTFIREKEYHE